MKLTLRDKIITALIITFSLSSIAYMAGNSTPFTSVLESQKNILIEEQLGLEQETGKIKETLSKQEEKMKRLQGFIDSLQAQIQANKDTHNKNTGKIESIDSTLTLYQGLATEK